MAFMRKIKDRYYAVMKLADGRQKSIALKTCNEREAKQRLRKIQEVEVMIKSRIASESDLRDLLGIDSESGFQIGQLIPKYIKSCKNRLSTSTEKRYEESLNEVIRLFGKHFDIRHFKPKDYDVLLNGLKNSTRINKKTKKRELRFSSTTINIILRAVKTFFYWASDNGYIENGLPFKIKQIKIENVLPRFLTDSQVSALLKSCESQPIIQAVFRVYLGTGMRLGELPGSKLLDGNYLYIYSDKTKTERYVPIHPELIADYILVKDRSLSQSYSTHRFLHYKKKAGLPENLTFHSLRHTYAVKHWLSCGDIKMTKDALGHTLLKTTEIYTKLPKDYLLSVCNVNRKATAAKRLTVPIAIPRIEYAQLN
ncbi:tyrosine-type recombinase/integrase [bacterium]|nr:tyrosine-type recombinase/integrase [bacterium]MBU1635338.1 tyrosine-type recombinase/integrase [bacterium]MBU1873798.1 tyrosine-type recombinase/integrase [bacterium]